MGTITRLYKLNPAISLYWVGWDDEFVVFDETSGQTHQLDVFRAFVLNLLEGVALSSEDMLSELNREISTTEDVDKYLAKVLEEFEAYGLIVSSKA